MTKGDFLAVTWRTPDLPRSQLDHPEQRKILSPFRLTLSGTLTKIH